MYARISKWAGAQYASPSSEKMSHYPIADNDPELTAASLCLSTYSAESVIIRNVLSSFSDSAIS